MKLRSAATRLAIHTIFVAGLAAGCSPGERYEVLSHVFDGVPPPPLEVAEGAGAGGAANGAAAQRPAFTVHGPYGAKLCTACHASAATNTLVAPREELCLRCHEIKFDEAYVHGPLASGGCTVCHDPHSSRNRFLLVGTSETFCLSCHQRADLAKTTGHGEGEGECTSCHDAHMSNRKYLLR